MNELQVLLLPASVVGHLRLVLLLAGMCLGATSPGVSAALIVASLALDALDGHLARRLGQCTTYGAFLDVAVDLVSRGVLWTWGSPSPWAVLPVLLECLTFACTHKEGGAAWKTGCFTSAPPWVRAVMRGGFRSPCGALAVAGLMGCPLWLWARRQPLGSGGLHPLGLSGVDAKGLGRGGDLVGLLAWGGWGWVVVPGRLLAAAVELWVVNRHLRGLMQQDVAGWRGKGARSGAAPD